MTDPRRQIEECRRDMAELTAMWRGVAGRSAARPRREAEAQIFNQMVVALEERFGALAPHGQIALEVRLLAEGVRGNGRFPLAESWRAVSSVTGYHAGDRIALSEEAFSRLSDVFLHDVARVAKSRLADA